MPSVSLADAKAPLVLAIDLGTSSFRALLFDARARAVDGTEAQHGHQVRSTPDGGAEADAPALFDLLVRCVDGALANAGDRAADIAAVGHSCFWHSLLGVDAAGEPTTPLLIWADKRSAPQVAGLRRELEPAETHARTGCVLHSSYWPAKLRWLQATAPEAVARTVRYLSFAEYAADRLQGDPRASLSMASGTGLLDVHRLTWDPAVAEAAGVPRTQLPELTDRDLPLAPLRAPWAARWGVLAGLPWFPAVGDGAGANVGSGAVAPDRIALTLGTSGALRVVRPPGEVHPPTDVWTYRLDRDRAVLGGALSNGGNLLAWLGGMLDIDFGDETIEAAGEMPPDAHGLTVLPFLAGERSPSWNDRSRGVVAGLTLATESRDLVRATMEAVAYRFARIYDRLAPLASPGHEVVANGGAILRSPAWLQIVADTLGHELRTLPPDEEASARGAAVLALVGAGHLPDLRGQPDPVTATVYRPDPARHVRYREGLARQSDLEARLFPDGTAWDVPAAAP